MPSENRRILVTGGGTFLGDNIAAALLAEGAEVTLLVRPGAEDKLGPLAQRVRWWTADVWTPASLRGRARGHASVVHTIGSMVSDPAQGLNHNWLNFVSARNVANMCVGDGVNHMVLMSSARAPWVNSHYLQAKRQAEEYMERVGLDTTIIRAPVAYVRGQRRHLFYLLMTILGSTPVVSWFWFGRVAPLPVDMLARGVARITLDAKRTRRIYYAADLRKRNTAREARRAAPLLPTEAPLPSQAVHPFKLIDEDTPFGWTPPERRDDE
ncbi:MAG: SDR family oxidoreductase [Anaerolineae bacterium]|nr:SDR family oxidoreductase [Anaerolineae bacterium]